MNKREKRPLERDELFERVRAAKTIISTVRSQEQADKMEIAAFMAIFHPDVKEKGK